ncbi:hypothetical protein D9757_008251 [Collybiopsis confluens]|nr:hypothetical protein D9757_008251 [Collybiopsis confluens]
MAAQYEDDHPQLMQQIATINLSDPPLRHPFCHPDTLPPTMGELSARVDQGSIFPVSFGHTSIKQLKTQPMIAPNTPDPSDFVDFADKSYVKSTDGRDNRSTYHYDGNAAKSIKSASSSQTTPSKRDGRTEASAKSWLLGWLVHVDMFYCHVTHHVPYATPGFVQLAHILLPKAQINNNPLLLLYEFSLGMSVRSICLHSRLFIMPAVMHIHKLIDGQLIFIIPSLEVLRSALLYLNMVLDARSSKDQNEREKADFLWGQLRGGNLSAFVELADGNVHKYHIIPHPGANSWLRSLCFPCSGDGFYSHISPFAAL